MINFGKFTVFIVSYFNICVAVVVFVSAIVAVVLLGGTQLKSGV